MDNIKETLILIREYLKKSKDLDSKTLKAYRIDLTKYCEFVRQFNIDPFEKTTAQKYIESLTKEYKPATVKRKVASLRAFYFWIQEKEYITQNIFEKIKIEIPEMKEIEILTKESIEQIEEIMFMQLHKANSEYQRKITIRDIAIIELLLSTGMRISELCKLQDGDINLQIGSVHIGNKEYSERMLVIDNKKIIDLLKEYRAGNLEDIKNTEYFFINRNKNPLSEQSVREMLKKYSKRAGLDLHITPNTFRKSYTSVLLKNGKDIKDVQEIVGHGSIVTTMKYANKPKRNILVSKRMYE